jgi:signal transduction histidine kinase
MRMFSSIRIRLTLSYLLVFGLVQTAVCILVISQRERRAAAEFDVCLEEQARAMANVIEIAAEGELSRYDIQEVRQYARAFGCADFYHEVRRADGTLLESSANLAKHEMRAYLPDLDTLRDRQVMFQRIAGDEVNELLGDGTAMRLLSYYHVPEAGQPFIIQVAMNLAKLDGFNRELRGAFVRVSLLALAAAGLTAWLLSKRSLRPIASLEEKVAEIHPDGLDQRLDVDGSATELTDLTETVNAMLARLDRAFSAQSEFLTHAAHELKTPLAVLLGETQRMQRARREVAAYEDHLGEMEQELRRFAKVIDSLLMLAKARAGTRDLDESRISANDFVTEAQERCQGLARHREIKQQATLAFDEESGAEPIVTGDERLLIAMVENLIRNAIRVSPVGSTVRTLVSQDDETVQVIVRDQGPGIPPEERDTLFTAFVSKPIDGRQTGGTGIGLAIVNSVVHLHGGTIQVTDAPDGGAEFVIRLPRADDADSPSVETGSDDAHV